MAALLRGERGYRDEFLPPIPHGPSGVIKPGAHPDLILLDGDPTRDIRLLMDAESTIDLIVKDGKIDKNIVSSPRHRIRSIR